MASIFFPVDKKEKENPVSFTSCDTVLINSCLLMQKSF